MRKVKVGPRIHLYMELWDPYKWPNTWVAEVEKTLLRGVIAPLIGVNYNPSYRGYKYTYTSIYN